MSNWATGLYVIEAFDPGIKPVDPEIIKAVRAIYEAQERVFKANHHKMGRIDLA